jgi:hypothetical protein
MQYRHCEGEARSKPAGNTLDCFAYRLAMTEAEWYEGRVPSLRGAQRRSKPENVRFGLVQKHGLLRLSARNDVAKWCLALAMTDTRRKLK